MISVCIPVFNTKVNSLVHQLFQLLTTAQIPFEILLWDDGSTHHKEENQALAKNNPNINWFASAHNKGRSATRNLLAKQAKYQYLLFLDNDVLIKNNQFIQQYINQIQKNKNLIYGGIQYPSKAPNPKQALRWKYEQRARNNTNPINTFGTCNFLVEKSIITQIPFDESLSKYGFEDTLWIKQVLKAGYTFTTIPNPVFGEQLDENQEFLAKTSLAMQNLAQLYKAGKLQASDGIKLLQTYENFKAAKRFWLSSLLEKLLPKKLFPVLTFQLFKLNELRRYLQ